MNTRTRYAKQLVETTNIAPFLSESKNSPVNAVAVKKGQPHVLATHDSGVMPKTRRQYVVKRTIPLPIATLANVADVPKNSPANAVTSKKGQPHALAIPESAVMPKTRRQYVVKRTIPAAKPLATVTAVLTEQTNGVKSANDRRVKPYSLETNKKSLAKKPELDLGQASSGTLRETRNRDKLNRAADAKLNSIEKIASNVSGGSIASKVTSETKTPAATKSMRMNKQKKIHPNGDAQQPPIGEQMPNTTATIIKAQIQPKRNNTDTIVIDTTNEISTISISSADDEMMGKSGPVKSSAARQKRLSPIMGKAPKVQSVRVNLTPLNLTDVANQKEASLHSEVANGNLKASKRKRSEENSFGCSYESFAASVGNIPTTSGNENNISSASSGKQSNDSILSTLSTASVQLDKNIVKFFEIASSVLKREYFNVVQRMNLSHQPLCLTRLEKCVEHHKKNFQIEHLDNYMTTKLSILLRTYKPTIFVRVIGNISLQRLFPNKEVIFLLLEHILTINQPFDDEYDAKSVIQMAAFAYAKILENFPPCCSPCKSTYNQVIVEPIGDTKLPIDKFNPDLGLLSNLLIVLDYIIQQGRIADANLTLNETDDLMDFFKWSAKTDQKYSFEQLSRVEKIERIFLVLNLLVQLMENDLAMWMLINANNTDVKMIEERKMPLIAHYLWPNEQAGQINYQIKKILELFVNYVSINFDPYKIGIVARLVNLIFHSVNLTETSDNDGIRYPNIQNRTRTLCDALNNKIQCNQSYSVQLYWNVLKQILSPIMKLEISKKLINKLNGTSIEVTPREIYDLITTGNWLTMEEDTPEASQPFASPCGMFSQNFPCMEEKKRKSASGLDAKEYIEVLQTAFEAYLNTYHINELIESYKMNLPVDQVSIKKPSKKSDLNKPDDYEALEWELSLDPDTFDDIDNDDPIYPNDIINKNLMPAIDISLSSRDVEQYRSDIKYYDLIKELVANAKNDYFKNWFKNDIAPNSN